RILLLTAHPDDECFFFAPTILALRRGVSQPEVYSLCLSTGNAEGLGDKRRAELDRSLDVLGVDSDKRWVVDHPLLQDNITMRWDPSVIADVLTPFVVDNNITMILTFDTQGISSHPNHYSLPFGASYLARTLSSTRSRTENALRVLGLLTIPVVPKYFGILAVPLARARIILSWLIPRVLSPSTAIFTSGFREYSIGSRAIRDHDSQMVWFRYLYMLFSSYLWVNEWVEI
ncbi:putative deacetylase LmbE-like domain-containing protein, partial [Pisolithus marmoratus]